MRTRALSLTFLIAAVLLGVQGGPARADGSDADFGDTVTGDVKLTGDIATTWVNFAVPLGWRE